MIYDFIEEMNELTKEENDKMVPQAAESQNSSKDQIKIRKNQQVISEFLCEYEDAFSSIKEKCQKCVPNFTEKLILYDQDKYESFRFKIEEQLNNFEIVILKVWIGSFTTSVKILNLDIISPLSAFKSMAEGNFGQIYTFKFLEQSIAVKSYRISDGQTSLKKSLKKIILEYCIFKICDALRCGPYISNYFGFDILIFRDHVQFAMEKCQNLDFHDKYQEQLRENLGILHRYKIMHMDINWNNIMYSPTYRKNIFIDFGFSEVIAEECGFKTYTSFKGTPQYISSEMMKLFNENNSFGFVDLYYNDLTGLQVTLKSFDDSVRKMSSQQNDSLKGYQPDYEELEVKKRINGANDYIQYILILLKHEYYFNKSNIKAVLQVEGQILMKQYYKMVIRLFSKQLFVFCEDEFIFSELKELSKTVEYKQYLQKLSNKEFQLSSNQTNSLVTNQVHSYEKIFTQNLLNNDQTSKEEQFIESALKFLKQKPVLAIQEERNKYFAIFFDLVRFDKRNISLSVKQQISNDFLTFTKGTTLINSKNPLDSIKQSIEYLFHYCLSLPQTRWKEERLFEMLLQCIFLELDFSDGLLVIQKKIVSKCYNCSQLVYILYQYLLMNTIFEMKHKCSNYQIEGRLINHVKKDSQTIAVFIIENYSKSQITQEKATADVIALQFKLKKNPSRDYQCFEPILSKIKDQRLQIALTKISLLIELQNSKKLSDFSLWTRVVEKIKQALFLNARVNLNNFKDRLVWSYLISWQSQLVQSYQRYIQQIKTTINCPPIYDTLVLKFAFWLIPTQKDPNFLRTLYLELIICCFQQKKFNVHSFLFCDIINPLLRNKKLREENMDIIAEISQKYVEFLEQHIKGKLQVSDYLSKDHFLKDKQQVSTQQESSYLNLHGFQGFFYELLLRCGKHMQHFVSLYERIINHYRWKALEIDALSDNCSFKQTKFISFYYYNMLRYKAMHERNISKIYRYESQILKMASCQFPQYLFKSMFLLSLYISKEQIDCKQLQIEQIIVWAWKFHEITGNMKAYFVETPKRQLILKEVLQILYLATQQKDRVYQFLQSIVKALGKEPMRQNINVFISNISIFYKCYPQFFDYKVLKEKLQPLSWSNRYQLICFSLALLRSERSQQISELIKIIAENIKYVRWNCQECILNHYFETMLRKWVIKKFTKRKHIFVTKFLTTKILLHQYQYHQTKLRQFLKITSLNKKQVNFFKKKLKQKILKWKIKKIKPFQRLDLIKQEW